MKVEITVIFEANVPDNVNIDSLITNIDLGNVGLGSLDDNDDDNVAMNGEVVSYETVSVFILENETDE